MNRSVLSHPKAFAYAGWIAMIPKLGLSLFIGIVLSILVKRNSCLSFLILSYPFVAFIIDGLLHVFRNRLWKPLSSNAVIPSEWEVNAIELEQYAKNLPKIRLMRLITIPILMTLFVPFLKENDTLALALLKGFIAFFFLSFLFDPLWRKLLKIKKPVVFELKSSDHAMTQSLNTEDFDDLDPTVLGSMTWEMAQMDPSIPGTPAWIMKQNQDF